jgi:ABC-type sulfate transport system permease component
MKKYLPIIIMAVIILIIPLSSAHPDGLERVAEDNGFMHLEKNVINALFGDYTVPHITGPVSSILSGIIGAAAVYILVRVLFDLGKNK